MQQASVGSWRLLPSERSELQTGHRGQRPLSLIAENSSTTIQMNSIFGWLKRRSARSSPLSVAAVDQVTFSAKLVRKGFLQPCCHRRRQPACRDRNSQVAQANTKRATALRQHAKPARAGADDEGVAGIADTAIANSEEGRRDRSTLRSCPSRSRCHFVAGAHLLHEPGALNRIGKPRMVYVGNGKLTAGCRPWISNGRATRGMVAAVYRGRNRGSGLGCGAFRTWSLPPRKLRPDTSSPVWKNRKSPGGTLHPGRKSARLPIRLGK